MSLTPLQINLIKSSFAAVYFNQEKSAKVFYDRLFEIAPQMRPLFTSDMKVQGKKLMDLLSVLVSATSHQSNFELLVQDTAEKHIGYGATPKYYELVGEALLWMMQEQLRNDFTPAVQEAWTEVYQMIATAMQRVGSRAQEKT